MPNSPLSFLFVGYCSHADLFRDFLDRTGAGIVTQHPADADAVCVFERDATTHEALALPHLQAGLPVFVEKPLAPDQASAKRICAAGLVTSFSTLRWAELDGVSGAQTLKVIGPARESDPSGWGFYGVHAVEIAQQVMGGVPDDVRAERSGNGIRVSYRLGGHPIELELSPEHSEWTLMARLADDTTSSTRVSAGPGYFEPASREIVKFARERRSPISVEEMLGVVAVVESLSSI